MTPLAAALAAGFIAGGILARVRSAVVAALVCVAGAATFSALLAHAATARHRGLPPGSLVIGAAFAAIVPALLLLSTLAGRLLSDDGDDD
jgi:hypothetical protein